MNRRVKNITGHPAPSSDALARSAEYQARYGSLDSIEFPRRHQKVSLMRPSARTLLARRVLKLESEWS